MKKFKRLVLPLSLIGMLLLGSTSVFANQIDKSLLNSNYNVIKFDKDGNVTYSYEPGATYDTPTPDNERARGRITVQASDVWKLVDDSNGHGPEYSAYGYVKAPEWHYSKAEMWYQGSQYVGGGKFWGTGEVYAQSYPCYGPNAIPRIFYGDN